MVTWLTRSLIFIVGGAVLAFAVTHQHGSRTTAPNTARRSTSTPLARFCCSSGCFDLIAELLPCRCTSATPGSRWIPTSPTQRAAALDAPLSRADGDQQVYATAPNVAVPPAAPRRAPRVRRTGTARLRAARAARLCTAGAARPMLSPPVTRQATRGPIDETPPDPRSTRRL